MANPVRLQRSRPLDDLHNATAGIRVMLDELPKDRDGTVEAALRRAIQHISAATNMLEYANNKTGAR